MSFRSSLLSLLLTVAFVTIGAPVARAQLNAQEQKIASLLTNAAGQQRPFVQVDPILSKVARARAADMARRHYFAHVNPDGHGPNYLVRQAGYPLPAGYDQSPSGNNIESCAAGDATPEAAWNGWMGSSPHKTHLLALNTFYVGQTSLGVGYCHDPHSDYQHYWVVITAPPPGPTLAITSPAANAGLTVPQATVAGTSGGSPAAARMVIRLENSNGIGAFANATGTTSWSGAVNGLVPGPNTVRVRSLDVAVATIKEATRTFRYVVLKPLSVAVEGNGSVTAGFIGTSSRELGAQYSIKATPAAGWLFDRWSGSATSTNATLAFTMQEGFAVTALFRENPFYARRDAYSGLAMAAVPTHASSGLLKISTAVTGAFSGRLALGGRSYAVSGRFDSAGNAQATITRPGMPSLTLALRLDLVGNSGISGTVTDGTFVASISADQAPPVTGNHFAAGRYTVSFPANVGDTGPQFPRGAGSALLVVAKSGVGTLTGTLADGRPFTVSTVVAADGTMPVYVPLLGGTASLAGSVAFDAHTGALTGEVRWVKPERPLDRYLPAAFATRLPVRGARYTAPKAGVPALVVSAEQNNSALQLAGGDLQSAVNQSATLLPTNVVAIVDPALPKMALTLTAATGRFTGTFTHPETHALSRITGIILQDANEAAGFFLGQSASGAANFAPAP